MVCSVPATGSTGVADFLKNPGLGYGWRHRFRLWVHGQCGRLAESKASYSGQLVHYLGF